MFHIFYIIIIIRMRNKTIKKNVVSLYKKKHILKYGTRCVTGFSLHLLYLFLLLLLYFI